MFKFSSQSKDIFKISLNIYYSDINIFEEFFAEKVSATSAYEVESKTIEPQPNDIWCFEAYCNNKVNYTLKKKFNNL